MNTVCSRKFFRKLHQTPIQITTFLQKWNSECTVRGMQCDMHVRARTLASVGTLFFRLQDMKSFWFRRARMGTRGIALEIVGNEMCW